MKKSALFKKEELFCRHIINRDGEKSWRYLRPVVIDFLDWFRGAIEKPVYINNWLWGGNKTQRGFRCNLCYEVTKQEGLYVSAHITGCGIDLNVKGMTANEVRSWIELNINKFFALHPWYIAKIRLESEKFAPTWVHIDFYEHNGDGIIQYVEPR